MELFRKRRFWLAAFFSATTTGGWLLGKMSGGEYIAAITVILGLYGIAAWKATNGK